MQMQHRGESMSDFNSVLILQKMVFDKIEFERIGFKNTKELESRIVAMSFCEPRSCLN